MRTTAVLAAVAFAASAGCDAKVNAFNASSAHICAGDPVELSWDVTGKATLKVTPPVAGGPDGPVASQGRATIAPTRATTVELSVTRCFGNPTKSIQQIRMARPEPLTASLGDPTATPGCANGRLFATVHARRFAPDMKVIAVTTRPGDDRSYEVDHAGVHAAIAAGGTATQFTDLVIVGDWTLSTPLRDGETCSIRLPNLGVLVFSECAAGGTHESQ